MQGYIESGRLTRKTTPQVTTTQHCLNCGTTYQGAYCPQCGQSHKVQRITAKGFITTLVSNIAGLQANLPRTLIDLFYHPGYLIADYLSGKRANYSNPFSTLLLLAATFIFLNQYAMPTDIRESTLSFSNQISTNIAQSMGVEEQPTPNDEYITTATTRGIYDNFGLFHLLIVPVVTIPLYLSFRRQGRYATQPLNIPEAATVSAFICCINLSISIISPPFTTPSTISVVTLIGYAIVTPLFLVTLWQMFRMPMLRFIWHTLLFFLYLFLLILASSTLFTLCYALYTMM